MEHEKELRAIGRKLLDKHGLHDWHVERQKERRKRALTPDDIWGYRDPNRKQIVVYPGTDSNFRLVVLHQIAHVLSGDDGHTMRWINKAGEIGLPHTYVMAYWPEAQIYEEADEASPFYRRDDRSK
jgi:hypothetical protein